MLTLGYDGVTLPTGDTIIFYPKNIRSINAAFDPDFKESGNLLAQSNAGEGDTYKSLSELSEYNQVQASEFTKSLISSKRSKQVGQSVSLYDEIRILKIWTFILLMKVSGWLRY